MSSTNNIVTIFSKFCCLLLLLLALTKNDIQVKGYIQEISLHNDAGDIFTFHSKVANLSSLQFLGKINEICVRGFWNLYRGEDYWSWGQISMSPNSTVTCESPGHYFPYRSLRFGGSSDTSQEVITLYSGTFYTSEELNAAVDEEPIFPNGFKGRSLIITGPSAWTIFEGQNFTGKSICTDDILDARAETDREILAAYDVTWVLGLEKIESVKKGCN